MTVPVPGAEYTMTTDEDQDRASANELLNTAMDYARRVLKRYGEIGPFAFSMKEDGSVSRETLDLPRLPADAESLWKLLHDHVSERARRSEIEAVAVAAIVTLAHPSPEGYSDGVVFHIERRGGYAVKVIVPYAIYGGLVWNLIPRRVVNGKLIMREIPATIFTASPQSPGFL